MSGCRPSRWATNQGLRCQCALTRDDPSLRWRCAMDPTIGCQPQMSLCPTQQRTIGRRCHLDLTSDVSVSAIKMSHQQDLRCQCAMRSNDPGLRCYCATDPTVLEKRSNGWYRVDRINQSKGKPQKVSEYIEKVSHVCSRYQQLSRSNITHIEVFCTKLIENLARGR